MSHPTGEKRDEGAERAAFISDLRALADMLENEPRLPLPAEFDGIAFIQGTATEKLAAVFAAAELLGTPVTYDRVRGVCRTDYRRGRVTYTVYAAVRSTPQEIDTVTVTSPDQILTTTATVARPDLTEPEHVSTALLQEAATQHVEHVPGAATPSTCFRCGKPVTDDDGRCALGEQMEQTIASLDAARHDTGAEPQHAEHAEHVESDAERGICQRCGASILDGYCSNPQSVDEDAGAVSGS